MLLSHKSTILILTGSNWFKTDFAGHETIIEVCDCSKLMTKFLFRTFIEGY